MAYWLIEKKEEGYIPRFMVSKGYSVRDKDLKIVRGEDTKYPMVVEDKKTGVITVSEDTSFKKRNEYKHKRVKEYPPIDKQIDSICEILMYLELSGLDLGYEGTRYL